MSTPEFTGRLRVMDLYGHYYAPLGKHAGNRKYRWTEDPQKCAKFRTYAAAKAAAKACNGLIVDGRSMIIDMRK